MPNLPTVRQLRYLVELHNTLHFRKAADACFVTQSAFSAAIKELESNLDVSLVERSNRAVVFTDVGLRVVEQSRTVLGNLREILELAQVAQTPFSGELRIGIIPTIAPFVLPHVLTSLQQQFADIEFSITEDKTRAIHQLLLNGELDLLLLALPYELANTEVTVLFDDPFLLAYKNGSRHLAANRDKHTDVQPPQVDQLPENSILLLDDGHCMREQALQSCAVKNRRKLQRHAAHSLHGLVKMIDADAGVTFLPQLALNANILHGTDVCPTQLPQAHRKIGVAWRKSSACETRICAHCRRPATMPRGMREISNCVMK